MRRPVHSDLTKRLKANPKQFDLKNASEVEVPSIFLAEVAFEMDFDVQR